MQGALSDLHSSEIIICLLGEENRGERMGKEIKSGGEEKEIQMQRNNDNDNSLFSMLVE